MRGFPKIFCTKQDYLNLLADPEYADQAKERLRSLAADRFIWKDSGEVFEPVPVPAGATEAEENETIAANAAARAELDNGENSRLINTAKEGEPEKWSIFNLVEDPNAEIFRLGFTIEEVEELTE